MIFTGSGIEVVTDEAVVVPAGSAEDFGEASVSAHALVTGKKGNIASFSINQVYGTSLFIRNLHSFIGGKDSYSVQVVTTKDRQNAIDTARAFLAAQRAKIHEFLAFPCKETAQVKNDVVGLSWVCQYIIYSVPSYTKVPAVRLFGKYLFVEVVFVARPRRIETK